MLIRFTTENFLSFRQRAELSMVPSKVKRHDHHIVTDSSCDGIDALRGAVIYGANASGKSNLILAMSVAQSMICSGAPTNKALSGKVFALGDGSLPSSSRFEFEFKSGESTYAYGFVASAAKIHEEWLYKISRKTEKLIFERRDTSEFDFSGLEFKDEKDGDFVNFVAKGTNHKRLFLHEAVDRNIASADSDFPDLRSAAHWFHYNLTIIFPNTKYSGLEIFKNEENNSFTDSLGDFLKRYDTGIDKLELKEVDFDSEAANFPESLRDHIYETLESEESMLITTRKGVRLALTKKGDGAISCCKLVTVHKKSDGKEAQFDIPQESDGTQRLLDLAPAMLDTFHADRVCIIDEIDRSLHPKITLALIKNFFGSTGSKNSQLIVTTHENTLLNQDFIRKDEVWFVRKNSQGESSLYSLEEFKNVRFDKDIRRGYLDGRYGGIPNIRLPQKSLMQEANEVSC